MKFMWGVQQVELPESVERDGLRLTIPAREALVAAGNTVRPSAEDKYIVGLRQPPPGLVVVRTPDGLGIRRADEPKYPGEFSAAWHERGEFVPCSECGAAMMWWEAGYVPGWRVCLAGHANRLSSDGRRATRQPDSDLEPEV